MKLSIKLSLLVSMLALASCGFPGNKLTSEERVADMQWAFTIFKHNYAPAELKNKNFGVDIAAVESDCVTLAAEEMTNDEFMGLYQKCVHTVRDAHVSAAQMNNGILPEFANVAHLGFSTLRTKIDWNGVPTEAVKVMSQFVGSQSPTYPVLPGDYIIEANGRPIAEVLKDDIVPYINLGQPESDLTFASTRFSLRSSLDMALPSDDSIELTVVRAGQVSQVRLPWIVEDLLAFTEQQQPPQSEDPGDMGELPASLVTNPLAQAFFGFEGLKALLDSFQSPVDAVVSRVKAIAITGFRFARYNPVMKALFNGEYDEGDMAAALKERAFPVAGSVDDLYQDPKIPAKIVKTDDGYTYAYLQISSFPGEDEFVAEFEKAINAIADKQIKSVVVDMIDNGGGSLIHGMRMANMLRKRPLKLPSMQVRLNNNWVNSFRTVAAMGATSAEKQIARGVVKKLKEDMDAGLKISRPLSIDVLDPFSLQDFSKGLDDDVKIAFLVNEICVSMCDIFASVVQDNDLGLLIGQRTMGGGGNVTGHALSPISKFMLNLTESLIITSSGKYIENNGVEPGLSVDMAADREAGFASALNAAFLYVTDQTPTP
ncbi:MAG: hypothetical protein KDD33_08095 [Bdellovibrionales bacterium]|nr:hypothetical protein [Bdellovibrionales bacterium]